MTEKKLHEISDLPTGTITQATGVAGIKDKQVYQRTGKKFGNIETDKSFGLQLRRHVIPFDPKSNAQLSQRSKFRKAVVTWQNMDEIEKAVYRDRANQLSLTGYQLFMSEEIKATI